ncbi:hypothetical protein EOI86_10215 [Hwanghaeella grinnelliae]|uniref:Uncharacterized protein n=1 Tax=Hwanghaeella grinnelliae TaxID=2500179 RepID=A0A3S2VR10_9PROT|nr:hypothetical protein EOI86_10215 [Hwanghaeella grinnelliae]
MAAGSCAFEHSFLLVCATRIINEVSDINCVVCNRTFKPLP